MKTKSTKAAATNAASTKAKMPAIDPVYDLSSPQFNIRKYIKAGLDPDGNGTGGWTPLYFAQIRGDWWAIGELVRRGASIKPPGGFVTPVAVEVGSCGPQWLMELLQSRGIDWNVPNWGSYSALMLAAMNGRSRTSSSCSRTVLTPIIRASGRAQPCTPASSCIKRTRRKSGAL
ncbi:MAG TPA: hypothetical protein VD997_06840 [Phycisphaerales bacterium]|nr:hypothetical protein [Phycisphaerales bacterium]